MIHRFRSPLAVLAATLATGPFLLPTPANGAYYVRSCFQDGIDTLWHPTTSAVATAYVSCPGAVHVRNVIGSGTAPAFSAAKLSVAAPPGTYFDEIHFDGYLLQNRGWRAGIWDPHYGRWIGAEPPAATCRSGAPST